MKEKFESILNYIRIKRNLNPEVEVFLEAIQGEEGMNKVKIIKRPHNAAINNKEFLFF